MDFAYVAENTGPDDNRDNTELFKIIQKAKIPEDRIFFKSENTLKELMDELDYGDRLVVLSVTDLADNISELQKILNELTEYKVKIYSMNESVFRGIDHNAILNTVIEIINKYRETKRLRGYTDALLEGRVGRPQKKEELDTAIRLLQTGEFTIDEVVELAQISSSTIYKYLGRRK